MTLDPKYSASGKRSSQNTNRTVKKNAYDEDAYSSRKSTSSGSRNVQRSSVKKGNRRNGKKKKNRSISSRFIWIFLILAAAVFLFSFHRLPMFPTSYTFLLAVILLLLLLLTGLITFACRPANIFTRILNGFLAIALLICAVLLPYYESKISEMFNTDGGNNITINCYAMREDYKNEHSSGFINTIQVPDPGTMVDITGYADAVYGSMVKVDVLNQQYAIQELTNTLGGTVNNLVDYSSLNEAVAALYNNQIDIMIMSSTYEGIVEDIEGYEEFSKETQIIYSFTRTITESTLTDPDTTLTENPFIIFFGGNDGEGELSLYGRTDVDMLVAVNPQTAQIAIISLPRDSYVANPAYDYEYDKLTHLGLLGLDNTLLELSDLFQQDISNYVLVNFTTFMNIISALGGVDVDNPYEFTALDDEYFPEGINHLNEGAALMYVRERKNLPDGDFGRNMHQQLVMKAIISKLTSPAIITNFNALLTSMSGSFLTNVSSDALYSLCEKQLSENLAWNIVNYHILGDTGYEVCASVQGDALSVVYPYQNQIDFASEVIQQVMNGEILTQEDLPDGY